MAGVGSVEEFRQALTPDQLAATDKLRAIAVSATPGLDERIKWNGPSFAIGDIDRISLGKDRSGAIRVVIHRGVKPLPLEGFAFDAPVDLVTWAAPDRGVMTFSNGAQVDTRADQIGDIFRRWLETE